MQRLEPPETSTEIPASLLPELDELHASFGLRARTAPDGKVHALASVRGVPVEVEIDPQSYPAAAPILRLGDGWGWRRRWALFGGGQAVRGLRSQEAWNRTLGLGALLRELEHAFLDEPPGRRRTLLPNPRRWGQALAVSGRRLRELVVSRMPGRAANREPRQPSVSTASTSVSTPVSSPTLSSTSGVAKTTDLLQTRAAQLDTYAETLDTLRRHAEERRAEIAVQDAKVDDLETRHERAIDAGRQRVEALRELGHEDAEIRADAEAAQRLRVCGEIGAELALERTWLDELRDDAEELEGEIAQRQQRLDALREDLELMGREARQAAAEDLLARLDQHYVALRDDAERSALIRERQARRREQRLQEARLRVDEKLSGQIETVEDEAYLRRARELDAAREAEQRLGLGSSAGSMAIDRAESDAG